jgi:membrane fusion protein (multidrug efflux system)
MKRIIIISSVILVLVGACAVQLFYNKKKIEVSTRVEKKEITFPVVVQGVRKGWMKDRFSVTGTIHPAHEVTLSAEGQGKVVAVLFENGDVVSEGQVLARLDDELVKSQLELARAAYSKAEKDLEKYERLLKVDGVTPQQLEDVRLAFTKAQTDLVTAKRMVENTVLKAPIGGTITKRYIEKGSLVMPGLMVADIVDVNRLKFIANVSEDEVVKLSKGMAALITVPIYPSSEYRGVIRTIGVKADEARRFPVEIELANDRAKPLRAGMYGTVTFEFSKEREAILASRKSITGSIKDPHVFVVENGKAILRPVVTGTVTDNEVEILSGLNPGDMVIVSGQVNLENGSPVTMINQ